MNLFMDSSNNNLSLIIENDNKIIDSFLHKDEQKISDIIFDKLNDLLNKNNLELSDIKNFYITIGPGSYTGVRVAMTIAKTIKTISVNSVKVYTISSLLFQAGKDNVVSLLDAKGKKWYLGIFKNGKTIIEEQLIPDEILNDFIIDFQDFKVIKDFEEINYEKNYLELKQYFKCIEKVEDLKPKYIKNFI